MCWECAGARNEAEEQEALRGVGGRPLRVMSARAEAGPGCANPGREGGTGCCGRRLCRGALELSVDRLGGDSQVGVGCVYVCVA